jgi:energy-coupling factor transporter ATP-binding protein EcfA2
VGAILGRKVWVQFGPEKLYPNFFIILLGPPGSRKSTAIKIAADLLKEAGYEHWVGEKSSKEKFMMDWEFGFDKIFRGEDNTKSDKEFNDLLADNLSNQDLRTKISPAYLKASELQAFFGNSSFDFLSTLTDLWDNPPNHTTRYKNSKSLFIPNPVVNLLGGATATTFASTFNLNIIGQGLLSRMLLVYGAGKRMKLTIPPALPNTPKEEILQVLNYLMTLPGGEITIDENARYALDDIYQDSYVVQDSRFLSYYERRLTHLIKLCIVIACTEFTNVIDERIVVMANTLLTYTENFMPSALGEFGQSRNSEVSQTILDVIKASEESGGINASDLLKQVSQELDRPQDLLNIVLKLVESGKVVSITK